MRQGERAQGLRRGDNQVTVLRRWLDILVPRRCIMCDGALACAEDVLCASCLMQAPLITQQDFACGEMCRLFWHLLPVERAAAMFRYSASSPWRRIVTAGKYGGRHDTLTGMGVLMGRHFMHQGFFDGADALLAMPTAGRRTWLRGYNQAELIAEGVSRATGLPLLKGVVRRTGSGLSQTHRLRQERLLSLRHDFDLVHPSAVAGRHVVLIDDVCTTGASLVALGEAVRQVPSVRLSVLTLMRTATV